jgi:glyoxylase-like metal-dependent hydrolase (beta-lactamase superfamily II)
MKKYLCTFLMLILGNSLSGFAWIQDVEKAQVVEVASNLFALIGPGGNGNVAFLVTEEGVIVVDAGETPALGHQIIAQIREKTDKSIRFILLTHYHGDHTLGLQSFPETALVIGHHNLFKNMKEILIEDMRAYPEYIEGLRKNVEKLRKEGSPELKSEEERLERNLKDYQEFKDVRIILPHLTFEEKLVIHLGEEKLEMYYPGNTHTSGSSVVYFPSRKTIHMGDMLFVGSHTYVDRRAGANTRNWISFLKQVQDWDIEKIIPGHGPLSSKDELGKEISYLENLRREVAATIQKGMTVEEAKKAVKMEAHKDLKWPEILLLVVDAVYRELMEERENNNDLFWPRYPHSSTERPAGRGYHAMAYDSESDRVILHGGGGVFEKERLEDYVLNQTWAYDLDTDAWTDVTVRWGEYFGQSKPGIMPEVFALGIISTDKNEHGSVVFASDLKEAYWTPIFFDPPRTTILFSQNRNGIWTEPRPVWFSDKYIDGVPAITKDGRRMYFTSFRPAHQDGLPKHRNIWFSERINKSWSEPMLVGDGISSGYEGMQVSVSDDGTLFFISARNNDPGKVESYHVYYSEWDNGKHAHPVLLEYSIKSKYGEHDPYIARDKSYLIFAAIRPDGFGDADLFISFRTQENCWTTPVNLGKNINTEHREFSPNVSPDGKYLFFVRDFGGENGDIYWVDAKIIKELREKS